MTSDKLHGGFVPLDSLHSHRRVEVFHVCIRLPQPKVLVREPAYYAGRISANRGKGTVPCVTDRCLQWLLHGANRALTGPFSMRHYSIAKRWPKTTPAEFTTMFA